MTSFENKLNGRVENGRTRRRGDDPDEPYVAYDLTTAKAGDTLTIATSDPDRKDKRVKEIFDLVKQETPRGASALEGWTLVTEMGSRTVALTLLRRMKGGGATAEHHRVVLREGLELGVSVEIPDQVNPEDEDPLNTRGATPTICNMGKLAVIMDGLEVGNDLKELSDDMRAYRA